MKKKYAKMWAKALRSGEYKKGIGRLKREVGEGNFHYCCLGVLCELMGEKGKLYDNDYCDQKWVFDTYRSPKKQKAYDKYLKEIDEINAPLVNPHNAVFLPYKIQKKVGMKSECGILETPSLPSLTDLNDNPNNTFDDIANVIEEHYKEL